MLQKILELFPNGIKNKLNKNPIKYKKTINSFLYNIRLISKCGFLCYVIVQLDKKFELQNVYIGTPNIVDKIYKIFYIFLLYFY